MTMTEIKKSRGNFEEEFATSLSIERYFTYFLREGFDDQLLADNTARAIWRFAREYYERAHAIPTIDVLAEEFPKFQFAAPNGEPHWLLDKLRELYTTREARSISREIASRTVENPDDMFDYMKEKVFERERIVGSNQYVYGPHNVSVISEFYFDNLANRREMGFTTGWPYVDDVTGGFLPGQIVPVLARPKRMKSWMGLQAWISQRKQGKNPYFFTLELSPEEIWRRISAMISGVSFNDIEKGRLEFTDIQKIHIAWDELGGMGTYHFARPPVGKRTVPDILVEADKVDADSIIIDQFSFIEPRNEDYRREDLKHAEIIYDLKAAATRPGFERPIFFMAQFNRQQDGEDELSAARAALTGALEQASDSIFGLTSNKELRANQQVKFVIMEGRNHESGDEFIVDYELKKWTNFEMWERGAFPAEVTPDGSLMS